MTTGARRRRFIAAVLLLATTSVWSGCGTVFYGRTQTILVDAAPVGATASLAGQEVTAPGSVTIQRSQPGGWAVLRATAPGYQPACAVVRGTLRVGFVVLDCLFLGLPMLVDIIGVGSPNALREYPNSVRLALHPLAPDEIAQPLPSDAEVINLRRRTWVDLCDPRDLRRVSAAATQCFADGARIESAVADDVKVSWNFQCGENLFACSSTRKLTAVACTEAY
jgi:hypothetical protein